MDVLSGQGPLFIVAFFFFVKQLTPTAYDQDCTD